MAEYQNGFEPDEGVEIPVEFEEEQEENAGTCTEQDTEPDDGCTGNTGEPQDGSPEQKEASDEDSCGSSPADPAEGAGEETGPGDTADGEDETAPGQEDPDEEASPDGQEAGGQDGKKQAKGGWFGRKRDKEKEKLEQQVADLTDRFMRSRAEFDNFRKRTEKEKASMYIIGARDIVEKILPIVDSFERGLGQAPEGDPFAEGMQLIYKQLTTTLEELGVKPIEAVGQPFDPNLHNAVMHVDDEEVGENVVVEEFQKGYTYKDFVVRHSMVKVAN